MTGSATAAYNKVLYKAHETRIKTSDRVPSLLTRAGLQEEQYLIIKGFDPEQAQGFRNTAAELYRLAAFYDPGNKEAMDGVERLAEPDFEF